MMSTILNVTRNDTTPLFLFQNDSDTESIRVLADIETDPIFFSLETTKLKIFFFTEALKNTGKNTSLKQDSSFRTKITYTANRIKYKYNKINTSKSRRMFI